MSPDTLSLATHPTLAGLAPDDVLDAYRSRGFDALSDARLTEIVARSLARPKAAPADSFVLHAPLELMARAALLPLVAPQSRDLARQRLLWLGARYEAAGEPAPEPARARRGHDRPEDAIPRLVQAIDRGELEDADDAAVSLASVLAPPELSRALAETVLPRLSAAAHGNIALFQLPRVMPRSAVVPGCLRGLVRELAREPRAALTWHVGRSPKDASGEEEAAGADLVERLRRPDSVGDPGSDFILPTMSLVERTGLAAEVLGAPTRALGVRRATQLLARVAAWSMLQDDPTRAPYIWTHCLSLPQAALGIAHLTNRPGDAVAVAATHVLGFRAVHGRVTLDPGWAPSPADPVAGGVESPAEAAARVWHAPEAQIPALGTQLATRAAIHPDAHLAKYTLACFDAASADPEMARLYLAATAYLSAWWRQEARIEDLPSEDERWKR